MSIFGGLASIAQLGDMILRSTLAIYGFYKDARSAHERVTRLLSEIKVYAEELTTIELEEEENCTIMAKVQVREVSEALAAILTRLDREMQTQRTKH